MHSTVFVIVLDHNGSQACFPFIATHATYATNACIASILALEPLLRLRQLRLFRQLRTFLHRVGCTETKLGLVTTAHTRNAGRSVGARVRFIIGIRLMTSLAVESSLCSRNLRLTAGGCVEIGSL